MQRSHFGVVIDAGSSGSRIQIYSWLQHDLARQDLRSQGEPLARLPKVEVGVPFGDGWHARVEPGISSFGPHPDDLDAYLKPLLDHALQIIPPDRIQETPIFLLATAGMRLIPKPQQQAVLHRACQYISNHYGFYLKNCAENVRIISGEEEGLFGWVAVNYLMDGFDSHIHGEEHSSTFGFLDMGGASTQIAFEPSPSEQVKHADNLVDVILRNLDGRTLKHPVFVTTWLGYGTNQARQRYVETILAQPTSPLANPSDTGTEHHTTTLADPCLPKDLLLTEAAHPGYMLRGSGDFASCVRATAPLLNKDAPCLDEPCLFNGVHAPAIDFAVNRFIGISEYWYSTHDVFSMGGMYDFVAFEKGAIDYCKQEWQTIVDAHASGSKWKPNVELSRLEMQCFKAAWIVNILHEGIGIPRIVDQGGAGDGRNRSEQALQKAEAKGFAVSEQGRSPSFQSLDQIGDVSISWTLGKMVLEVSQSIEATGSNGEQSSEDWRDGFTTKLTHKPTPLLLAPAVVLAVVLWFYCRRTGRGRAFGGYFAPSRRRSDTTYSFDDLESGSKQRLPWLPWPCFLSNLNFRRKPTEISLPLHATGDANRERSKMTLRHAASSPNLQTFKVPAFSGSGTGSDDSLSPYVNPEQASSLRSLKREKNRTQWQLIQARTRRLSFSDDEGFTTTGYDSDAPSTPIPESDLPPGLGLLGRASSLLPASRAASTSDLSKGYFGRRKEKIAVDF